MLNFSYEMDFCTYFLDVGMWFIRVFSRCIIGKEFTCQWRNSRRLWYDPWVGKIHGGENGKILQCSCWYNPMDRRAWWATVHGVPKSYTRLDCVTQHIHTQVLSMEFAMGLRKTAHEPTVLASDLCLMYFNTKQFLLFHSFMKCYLWNINFFVIYEMMKLKQIVDSIEIKDSLYLRLRGEGGFALIDSEVLFICFLYHACS